MDKAALSLVNSTVTIVGFMVAWRGIFRLTQMTKWSPAVQHTLGFIAGTAFAVILFNTGITNPAGPITMLALAAALTFPEPFYRILNPICSPLLIFSLNNVTKKRATPSKTKPTPSASTHDGDEYLRFLANRARRSERNNHTGQRTLDEWKSDQITLWEGSTRPIEFSYESGQGRTRRKVQVKRIHQDSSGRWYLHGFCHLRQEDRTFSFDSITTMIKIGNHRLDPYDWADEVIDGEI